MLIEEAFRISEGFFFAAKITPQRLVAFNLGKNNSEGLFISIMSRVIRIL